jgi:hypothetical protein
MKMDIKAKGRAGVDWISGDKYRAFVRLLRSVGFLKKADNFLTD